MIEAKLLKLDHLLQYTFVDELEVNLMKQHVVHQLLVLLKQQHQLLVLLKHVVELQP